MTRSHTKPPGRRTTATALILLAIAALSGCASALGPQTNLMAIAQSAVPGRGNVFATLEPDGTAIVSGWVENRMGRTAVLRAVGAQPQVVRVVDRLNPFDYY